MHFGNGSQNDDFIFNGVMILNTKYFVFKIITFS